jgi:capsular polysaccharide transport system permease protein
MSQELRTGRSPASNASGLRTAFRRYGQVLFALFQREQEGRRRAPLESLLDTLEPALLVAVLTVLWTVLNRRHTSPLGGSSTLFVATAFFAKFLWIALSRKMVRSGPRSAQRRFPVERRLDHVIVQTVMVWLDFAVLGVFGFGIIIYGFFDDAGIPYNFIPIFESVAAITCLAFGWGMINKVLGKYFWPWVYIVAGLNRAMLLFSGAFFLAEFLPPSSRYILSLNPMYHAVALFRTGFYPNYPMLVLDTTFLTQCSIVAIFIGLVLERVTLRDES